MKKYACSCCEKPRVYSRSDKLASHRKKYDPTYTNYFDDLRDREAEKKRLYEESPRICYCGYVISFAERRNKFCSQSCAASYNNRKRRTICYCRNCSAELAHKQAKYCSQQCQAAYQRQTRIGRWMDGDADVATESNGNLAQWARTYLLEQIGFKCSDCGWSKRHPVTGRVPLEIDHIDGQFDNNVMSNLRVLCPCCHALTPNYGALNAGNGRDYRRARWQKKSLGV